MLPGEKGPVRQSAFYQGIDDREELDNLGPGSVSNQDHNRMGLYPLSISVFTTFQ